MTMADANETDFAIIVYREEDQWEADALPAAAAGDLDAFVRALRQQPSIGGTIGFAGVGDDFFVAVRVLGEDVTIFLSDLTAAVDYPLARQVLEALEIPVPADDELDQVLPAGDMSIFADLGLDEMDLGAMSADLDLFPEDAVAGIAERLGFGAAVERALDTALGPLTGGRAVLAPVTPGHPTSGYIASFEPAMRHALAEAALAADDEDIPVGAVITDGAGAVVARGHNRREADHDPTAHAEIVAIRRAAEVTGSWRLTGLTLVVTLEPCPMCAGAVTAARLDRLVYGAEDPKAGAVGSLWDVVRDRRLNHRPEVIGGVLAAECGDLLREFFARRRPK
jgi:putative tRNA adenosine deaminase-associated protein